MPKLKSLVIGSLATVLLASSGAHAGSILGDTFTLEGTLFNPTNAIGPASGTAGSSIPDPFAFDVSAPVNGDPFELVHARWRDENSFELRLETFLRPQSGDSNAAITLSDLNFAFNGAPVAITGVTFNPNANGYLDFFASPGNPGGAPRPADPIISFTANSITVQYGLDWSEQLFGDQPDLFFDVTTSELGAAAPEPGTFGLLAGGLVLLAPLRRRLGKRTL